MVMGCSMQAEDSRTNHLRNVSYEHGLSKASFQLQPFITHSDNMSSSLQRFELHALSIPTFQVFCSLSRKYVVHCKCGVSFMWASHAAHIYPLITSRLTLLIALIASTALFFPPSHRPFMYTKHSDLTLDRATLMYATGRPSDVHFLRTGKPFFTKKRGAFAASNFAQVSLYPPKNISTHICSPFMCDDGA